MRHTRINNDPQWSVGRARKKLKTWKLGTILISSRTATIRELKSFILKALKLIDELEAAMVSFYRAAPFVNRY